jgi:hypothetical protein
MFSEWQMDGTGLELCTFTGFGTSGVEYTWYLLLSLLLLSHFGNFLENMKERYLRTSARKTQTNQAEDSYWELRLAFRRPII